MAKTQKNFRIEDNLIDALNLLSEGSDATTVLQTLIFREAIYKLNQDQLHQLFGDDIERLMLMYAVAKK